MSTLLLADRQIPAASSLSPDTCGWSRSSRPTRSEAGSGCEGLVLKVSRLWAWPELGPRRSFVPLYCGVRAIIPQDFPIQSLTNRGAPDATNDKILMFDNVAGTALRVNSGTSRGLA